MMLADWRPLFHRIFSAVTETKYDVSTVLAAFRRLATIAGPDFPSAAEVDAIEALLDGKRLPGPDLSAAQFHMSETLAYLSVLDVPPVPSREKLGVGVWCSFLILGIAIDCGTDGFPEFWFNYIFGCSRGWQEYVSEEDFLQFYCCVVGVLGPILLARRE